MATSSHIQRTTELLIVQGEEFNFDIGVTDDAKVAIDLTAIVVTDIKLRAFQFVDDLIGSALVDLTGTVFDDGGNGVLRFVFFEATTSSLSPQTYIMYVEATLDSKKSNVLKDNLTILRGYNA